MRLRRPAALCAAVALALIVATPAGALTRPPQLQSRSAILIDARSGQVLFRQLPNREAAIASTTKLMTALLTLERAKPTDRFAAPPYHPLAAESRIDLRAGERMTARDLLYALMLESANDAAVTLANGVGGSQAGFVRLMNQRAQALGLTDTHYANPVGLDEAGNHSSARDLARLARVLLRNMTFQRIVNSPEATLLSGDRVRRVRNRNVLVHRYPFVDGVKTGYTIDAGNVLVGSGSRKGVRLISVVMDEPSESARDADTLALLQYGFDQYRVYRPVRRRERLAEVDVRYRGRSVPLLAAASYAFTGPRGERVTTRVEAPKQVDATRTDEALGQVVVIAGGKQVGAVPLVAAEAVEAATTGERVQHFVLRPLTLLAVAATVLLCALILRRRTQSR